MTPQIWLHIVLLFCGLCNAIGFDVKKIDECVGDIEADVDNPILKAEQEAQIGKGSRGDVTVLPTLVINNRQYRDIQTNGCLTNNGRCWKDTKANFTACRDTFRGRVCECPAVQGVKFTGDGYNQCEASGALRCEINNGGCWRDTKNGHTYSACIDDHTKGCKCPPGFKAIHGLRDPSDYGAVHAIG